MGRKIAPFLAWLDHHDHMKNRIFVSVIDKWIKWCRSLQCQKELSHFLNVIICFLNLFLILGNAIVDVDNFRFNIGSDTLIFQRFYNKLVARTRFWLQMVLLLWLFQLKWSFLCMMCYCHGNVVGVSANKQRFSRYHFRSRLRVGSLLAPDSGVNGFLSFLSISCAIHSACLSMRCTITTCSRKQCDIFKRIKTSMSYTDDGLGYKLVAVNGGTAGVVVVVGSLVYLVRIQMLPTFLLRERKPCRTLLHFQHIMYELIA